MVRAFLTLACSARESRSARAACRLSCFEVNCRKVSCGKMGIMSGMVVGGLGVRRVGTRVDMMLKSGWGKGNGVLTLRLKSAFSRPDMVTVQYLLWLV